MAGTRGERARAGEAGFSLLELMIASAILIIVTGVTVGALLQGNKLLSQGVSRVSVDDAAARLMSMIVADLRQSGPSTNDDTTGDDDDSDLNLDPGERSTLIQFRMAKSWNATNRRVTWSPLVSYEWRLGAPPVYRAAESQNGRDDNGNGLVDEGYVVRRQQKADGSWLPDVVLATDILRLAMPKRDGTWNMTTAGGSVAMLDSLLGIGGGSEPIGFRFERGPTPLADDRVTVVVTTGARLEDGSIYTRQMAETVLLRNN